MSRQSAFAYQGRKVDARTISRELGCQYVVEGSVRKIDDRIRVTAQLIDAPRDEHVWAERYDRRLEDAFALQDEICDHIVAAIRSRLAPPWYARGSRSGDLTRDCGNSGPPGSRRQATARHAVGDTWRAGARRPGGRTHLDTAAARPRALGTRGSAAAARSADRARTSTSAPSDLAATIGKRHSERPTARRRSSRRTRRRSVSQASPAERRSTTVPTRAPRRTGGRSARRRWRTRRYPGASVSGNSTIRDRHLPFSRCSIPARSSAITPSPTVRARLASVDFTVHLADEATLPADMVLVQSDRLPIALVSEDTVVDLPPFYLDRFEVTNREFKEFVDAGGYTRAELWRDLPFGDDVAGWSAAVSRFVDATGRPGPSTWEAGTYRDGAADHPVARRQLVRGRRLRAIPRQGTAHRLSLVPRSVFVERAPGVAGVGHHRRE